MLADVAERVRLDALQDSPGRLRLRDAASRVLQWVAHRPSHYSEMMLCDPEDVYPDHPDAKTGWVCDMCGRAGQEIMYHCNHPRCVFDECGLCFAERRRMQLAEAQPTEAQPPSQACTASLAFDAQSWHQSADYSSEATIWAALEGAGIRLLSARWLVKHAKEADNRLARRAALPRSAFLPASEAQRLYKLSDAAPRTGGHKALPIIAVSYVRDAEAASNEVAADAPFDPDGELLQALGAALDRWLPLYAMPHGAHDPRTGYMDMGVYLEHVCLAPGAFEANASSVAALFAHRRTTVYVVATAPAPIDDEYARHAHDQSRSHANACAGWSTATRALAHCPMLKIACIATASYLYLMHRYHDLLMEHAYNADPARVAAYEAHPRCM